MVTRRESSSNGECSSTMKISTLAIGSFSEMKEEEADIDLNSGDFDLNINEFHSSHDAPTASMTASDPSLYSSLGLSSSRLGSGTKTKGFTLGDSADDVEERSQSESEERSILAGTTSALSALASIFVSVGTIVSVSRRGSSPNQSGINVRNEGKKGCLSKINRRLTLIASILVSLGIIASTAKSWRPKKSKKSGNEYCERDDDCKSGTCGELSQKKIKDYLSEDSSLKLPLVPSDLSDEERFERMKVYEGLLNANKKVCKCTADDHCAALGDQNKCHSIVQLCYEEEAEVKPQLLNANCTSDSQCASGACKELDVTEVAASLRVRDPSQRKGGDKIMKLPEGLTLEDLNRDDLDLKAYLPELNHGRVCRCGKHHHCGAPHSGLFCIGNSGLCSREESTSPSSYPTPTPILTDLPFPSKQPSAGLDIGQQVKKIGNVPCANAGECYSNRCDKLNETKAMEGLNFTNVFNLSRADVEGNPALLRERFPALKVEGKVCLCIHDRASCNDGEKCAVQNAGRLCYPFKAPE